MKVLGILHMFGKGDAEKHEDILNEAIAAGVKLDKTIVLADSIKKKPRF